MEINCWNLCYGAIEIIVWSIPFDKWQSTWKFIHFFHRSRNLWVRCIKQKFVSRCSNAIYCVKCQMMSKELSDSFVSNKYQRRIREKFTFGLYQSNRYSMNWFSIRNCLKKIALFYFITHNKMYLNCLEFCFLQIEIVMLIREKRLLTVSPFYFLFLSDNLTVLILTVEFLLLFMYHIELKRFSKC